MEPTVFSGGTSVISSGVIISFQGKPIEIVTEPLDNSPYTIVFSFHKDEQRKEAYIKTKDLQNRIGIEFELYNFTNSLGTATTEPLAFASANEKGHSKQLFINFSVSIVGKASPTLQYTIYKEM